MGRCRCVIIWKDTGTEERCLQGAIPDSPFCSTCGERRHHPDLTASGLVIVTVYKGPELVEEAPF
jgi:hypothetical protein